MVDKYYTNIHPLILESQLIIFKDFYWTSKWLSYFNESMGRLMTLPLFCESELHDGNICGWNHISNKYLFSNIASQPDICNNSTMKLFFYICNLYIYITDRMTTNTYFLSGTSVPLEGVIAYSSNYSPYVLYGCFHHVDAHTNWWPGRHKRRRYSQIAIK